MERFFERLIESTMARLTLTGIMLLPLPFAGAYLGAAYLTSFQEAPFWRTLAGIFLSSALGLFGVGYMIFYPLERWVIHDRVLRSRWWLIGRVLLYIPAAALIGLGVHIIMRLGMGRYHPLVESAYYALSICYGAVGALLYSFLELGIEVSRRREARLKRQIEGCAGCSPRTSHMRSM